MRDYAKIEKLLRKSLKAMEQEGRSTKGFFIDCGNDYIRYGDGSTGAETWYHFTGLEIGGIRLTDHLSAVRVYGP